MDALFSRKKVEDKLEQIKRDPFQVSILGQTGVGKSSLLNALFGTNLKTDPVRPCTKEIEKVVIKGHKGYELWFFDLPGIGESNKADEEYLSQYRETFVKSDVVIWAFHSDSRSVTFDLDALSNILSPFNDVEQGELISKVTFVMTKADTISSQPWIFSKQGKNGFFAPSGEVRDILQQKALYYQESFLHPYGTFLISRTHNKEEITTIAHSQISCNEFFVEYKGWLNNDLLAGLKKQHPEYSSVFDRLYDNYQVIPCSSRLKLNLYRLMLVIVNKLGSEAIARFKNFIHGDSLDQIKIDTAKEFCNMIVIDPAKKVKLFDLRDMKL